MVLHGVKTIGPEGRMDETDILSDFKNNQLVLSVIYYSVSLYFKDSNLYFCLNTLLQNCLTQ